jgi:uncharacterized protein YdhG (YjbR/CyaY superfamily)
MILKKMTLKGHSSFYLRDGWLNKVLLHNDVEFLRNQQLASDVLGVGSAMVKSIKYYLNAMNLVNLVNKYEPRSDLFFDISKYDIYIEHDFTKYILHYQMISNADKATTWHTFFNYVNYDEMSKDEAIESIREIYKEAFPDLRYSMRSLSDDIDCLVNLYTRKDEKGVTPEDKLMSPLADLGLLAFDGKRIIKTTPNIEKIGADLVLYIIMSEIENKGNESSEGRYNISVDEIINETNNVGKILNLNRVEIYDFMNQLSGYANIEFHKTAGLDQLYIGDEYTSRGVLESYFKVCDNV